MIRVESRELEDVRSAFDQVAPSMDMVVIANPINAWMRQVNSEEIRRTFKYGGCLLELGCGTGEDAVRLAKVGFRIFAVDISDRMIEKAREKAAAEGVQDRVVLARGRIADLQQLLEKSPWKTFDGAYANFSLTYEPSLKPIAEDLHSVLKPGALVICTLPNRIVLSEALLYGLQLRFRRVLRRFEVPMVIEVQDCPLTIHTYSPWQVARAFEGFFELRGLMGIPVFLPPVYLHGMYKRLGGGQALLRHLDAFLGSRYPWNHLGEHTLFKFQRLGP